MNGNNDFVFNEFKIKVKITIKLLIRNAHTEIHNKKE
jgi:hypothetical protein